MNSKNQSYPYDDVTLVGMAAKGDLDAFNQLVLTYQDMAYNHARALLGDPVTAEDVTQDSFIKAYQGIPGFHGGSFRGWLLKIVTNTAYDLIRKSNRYPTQPLFPEDENDEIIESPNWLADPTGSVQDVVEQNELFNEIYKILNDLPDVHRSVITLIDLFELDYMEAAHILKVPIGTVKSRLVRARLRMKEKLLERNGYFTKTDMPLAVVTLYAE